MIMDLPEVYPKSASQEVQIAVLIVEMQHLTDSVKELVKAQADIRDKASYHAKKLEEIERVDHERADTKKTFWQLFKSQWYKVLLVGIMVTGFLVTNFEIVRQLPHS